MNSCFYKYILIVVFTLFLSKLHSEFLKTHLNTTVNLKYAAVYCDRFYTNCHISGNM